MITSFVALFGLVRLTSAECFTFLGFSTCNERSLGELKNPFSIEWWTVNVNHRRKEIRRCIRITQKSPLWRVAEIVPMLDELMVEAFDGDIFERIFEQATKYFADNGHPVELLVAPDTTFSDIYLSFKAHQNEVFAALDTLLASGVFDNDVANFLRRYKGVLRKGAFLMTLIPPVVFDPYLTIFDTLSEGSEGAPNLPPLNGGVLVMIDALTRSYASPGSR